MAPLTPRHRRAANLLGSGWSLAQVASEIGVNPRTVSRWSKRADVRDLIRKAREDLMPSAPTAEETLVSCLSATRPDGSPDFPSRIQAAKAILGTPVASDQAREQAARTERIYVLPDPRPGYVLPEDAGPDPEREPAEAVEQ